MTRSVASQETRAQPVRADLAKLAIGREPPVPAEPTDTAPDPILAAKIYVVDDELTNALLLERFLGRAGFTAVETFTDPRRALARIQASEPDVLLLDLHMPGLDGFAVLGALRDRADADAYLPVLILSGDLDRSVRSRALLGGASDFLTKPFDGEEVVLRVRNFARTRQLHQQVRARNAVLGSEVAETNRALAQAEATWRSVTDSLAHFSVAETPEATAAAICAELAVLQDVAGVALLVFTSGGNVMPLGLRLPTGVALAVNVPIPKSSAAALRRRATSGSWIETWSTMSPGAQYQRQLASAGLQAGAFVPMKSDSAVVGLLVVAATRGGAAARIGERLPVLEALAAVASALLAPGIDARQRADVVRAQVDATIRDAAFSPVFQPIVDLDSGAVVGYEALTRFRDGTPPDRYFADADAVGLGSELEAATLAAAVTVGAALPDAKFISLNVSPRLLLDNGHLTRTLKRVKRPIVLEITEYAAVADYAELRDAIGQLGPTVRLAVDDAGAGYSSFRHIVEVRPDFVKIDIGLVRAIERDPVREAFVAGLVHFTRQTGATLIAEGIETPEELIVLRTLGVQLGQGYYLGRPAPIDHLAAMPRAAPARGGPNGHRPDNSV